MPQTQTRVFLVQFDMDNDAFQDDPLTAAAAVLRGVAQRLADGEPVGQVRDLNGNTIGEYVITSRETPR